VLTAILSTAEFSFQNTQVLWLCISEYRESKADFSDILIAIQNTIYGCSQTYTFDTDAATLANFTLLD
jgi:predicted nucleic-acid-binding protein